jgi:hypothetical protein
LNQSQQIKPGFNINALLWGFGLVSLEVTSYTSEMEWKLLLQSLLSYTLFFRKGNHFGNGAPSYYGWQDAQAIIS